MANIRISKKAIEDYSGYLKRKLVISRVLGCINSLIGVLLIVFYFIGMTNDWIVLITIAECMGTCFLQNSSLQSIKSDKNAWIVVNNVFAFVMYLLVVFLFSFGFASGNLSFKF